MGALHHESWMVRSVCPHCNSVNERRVPVGERVVMVHCEHCTHGYEYLHVIQKPVLVRETVKPVGS